MAFCKICSCGEKVVFPRRMAYPDNCPACGRALEPFRTLNEDDPEVERLLAEARRSAEGGAEPKTSDDELVISSDLKYTLTFPDGTVIDIPDEGCIIGRTELGGEQLAAYPSVSRKHLRILPKRRAGLMAEDISKYGTLINGERKEKNTPFLLPRNAVITLCNVDIRLSEGQG